MAKNTVEQIDYFVWVKYVLISVSDKIGLDDFALGLIKTNPKAKIISTGETFKFIKDVLGRRADERLIQISNFTGQKETQGGLVKTLDFKIYLGLLTETYNIYHQSDLDRTGAVPIDMVVNNLYPFEKTVAKPGATLEMARGDIDIGGPTMIRASAKNFHRVASVTEPADYGKVINELASTGGKISLDLRWYLAQRAFQHTAAYDTAIASYMKTKTIEDVRKIYPRIENQK